MTKLEKIFLLQENESEFLKELLSFLEHLSCLYGSEEITRPEFFRALEDVEFKVLQFITLISQQKLSDLAQQPGEVKETLLENLRQIVVQIQSMLVKNSILLKNFARLNQELRTDLIRLNGDNYSAAGKLEIENKLIAGAIKEEV